MHNLESYIIKMLKKEIEPIFVMYLLFYLAFEPLLTIISYLIIIGLFPYFLILTFPYLPAPTSGPHHMALMDL